MAQGSRNFNGSSDNISHTALLPGSTVSWGIFGWVYPTSFPAALTMIFSQSSVGGGGEFCYFGPDTTGGGKLRAVVDGANADLSSTAMTVNTWNHVGITGDNSAVVRFYVNGAASGTANRTLSLTSTTGRFGCGVNNAGGTEFFFNGRIAEFGIWASTASTSGRLRDPEVSALNSGIRPPYVNSSTLIYYFPFDGLNSPEPIMGNLSGIGTHPKTATVTGTTVAMGPPYTLVTPKGMSFFSSTASPTVFRKTLSGIGTRTGTRQIEGYLGG